MREKNYFYYFPFLKKWYSNFSIRSSLSIPFLSRSDFLPLVFLSWQTKKNLEIISVPRTFFFFFLIFQRKTKTKRSSTHKTFSKESLLLQLVLVIFFLSNQSISHQLILIYLGLMKLKKNILFGFHRKNLNNLGWNPF